LPASVRPISLPPCSVPSFTKEPSDIRLGGAV
jgi:hypothetical protein